MVKIYRYEVKTETECFGPYNARTFFESSDKWLLYNKIRDSMGSKHNTSKHENAHRDMNYFTYKHYCACPTLAILKTWFKGFNKPLLSLGFNLVEYEVKEFIESGSGRQCAFKMEDVIKRTVLA